MPTISVIIPVYNARATLGQVLEAVFAPCSVSMECIVVDDGSTDGSMDLARQYPVELIDANGGPCGPAYARNLGAEAAKGDILFFVDSDVLIQSNTLDLVAQTFTDRPEIAALFGSYDESPLAAEFLSQYKNLYHHYVHQQAGEEASTFWSGCGAIRRQVFIETGGFNAQRYPKPSIEDIELGYRLKANGHRILLSKELQVKHLKRWSFSNLIKTDLIHRALPWTLLILQDRKIPNDLNLKFSQRLSSLLLVVLVVYLAAFSPQHNVLLLANLTVMFLMLVSSWRQQDGQLSFVMPMTIEIITYLSIATFSAMALLNGRPALLAPQAVLLPLIILASLFGTPGSRMNRVLLTSMMATLAAAFVLLLASYPAVLSLPFLGLLATIILLNRDLYRFFIQKRGYIFALAVLPLQLLYYFYSLAAFAIGGAIHFGKNGLKAKDSVASKRAV